MLCTVVERNENAGKISRRVTAIMEKKREIKGEGKCLGRNSANLHA